MTRIYKALTVSVLALTFSTGSIFAQEHHEDPHGNYVRHDEWHKGAKINHDDWNRAQPVDYHTYHLNPPPRGYEWRQVDGNYVLAAAATGLIASAIIASSIH